MNQPQVIQLTEYEPAVLPAEAIPYPAAELLWRNYGRQVAVEFPSPKTGDQWQFTAQGWVGYIPLTPDLAFLLQPKVPLGNLFRMLEYAYHLDSFTFLEGLVASDSLADFYERLAHVLAKRVLARGRQGWYRAYLPESGRPGSLRGRLDVVELARQPWTAELACDYETYTADVPDNQILAWTLQRIAQSGLCTERTIPAVRRAYRSLPVTVRPFQAADCTNRFYNRLNDDYRPLHALCRFFLEHSGPGHHSGDHLALPFLVNMARLYEEFVAQWLKAHLPRRLSLRIQQPIPIGTEASFAADLVLYDRTAGKVQAVIDTKYKQPERPDPADISQVVTYAEAVGCRQGILVYPAALSTPFDETIGDIRIRSLTFSLAADLEAAGQNFQMELLE
jgi:5-methylcytosine-specific restriction enzyme subunit McrC